MAQTNALLLLGLHNTRSIFTCWYFSRPILDCTSLISLISGHSEVIPVKSVVGDVRKLSDVRIAMEGVDAVIHTAGLVSFGTFPDVINMQEVNVKGINLHVRSIAHGRRGSWIACSPICPPRGAGGQMPRCTAKCQPMSIAWAHSM